LHSQWAINTMARFLIPSKIALLVLAELYISVDLASKPRLDLLKFIASRIVVKSDLDRASLHERYSLSSADDVSQFETVLSAEPTFVPGRTVYDLFLARLWDLEGPDALFALFQRMEELMNPPLVTEQHTETPRISRASPLGQFIRRCCVEFTRLQFSDTNALWHAFCDFRNSSYADWAPRNAEKAQALQDAQLSWAASELSLDAKASAEQMQTSTEDTSLLLTFSIHQLQKLGTRIPPDLKVNLERFLSQSLDASSTSLQHFLSFFEHWRAGQYTMALESLHRYFDYSLAARDAEGREGGNVKLYYQYALLHLSVLHADFERWEASVGAMEECVGTGMLTRQCKYSFLATASFDSPLPSSAFPRQLADELPQLARTKTRHACSSPSHGFSTFDKLTRRLRRRPRSAP